MISLRHALATGLLLGIALSVAACVSSRSAPAQRVSLFNGVDLSGWNVRCQPQDQGQTFWRVDQGTILCDSIGRRPKGYVWLVSDREFADFELTLQFQAYRHSPGNSGVQFRSRFDPTADGGWLDGPQVDIHPPTAMSWRTGLIYDETRGEQRWIFPGLKDWNMDPGFEPPSHVFRYGEDGESWNTLTVVCQGTRVKTVVNGVVRTEWDGAGVLNNAFHRKRNVGLTGHFALQLHAGDELQIRFKDILVREL